MAGGWCGCKLIGRAGGDRSREPPTPSSSTPEGGFNPDAFFLIEAGALGRDSGLRKAAEKADGAATIPCYDDEPGDVARLVREALGKDKVGLNAEALELFVARLPRERGVARQEIERLTLFLGPGSGRRRRPPTDLTPFLGVEPTPRWPKRRRTRSAASWPPPTPVFAARRRRAKPAQRRFGRWACIWAASGGP